MVGIVLAVLQQWCGINVIFNYAQEVFAAAGYSLSSMLFNIVITGVTMVVFTFVAIGTLENLGRFGRPTIQQRAPCHAPRQSR